MEKPPIACPIHLGKALTSYNVTHPDIACEFAAANCCCGDILDFVNHQGRLLIFCPNAQNHLFSFLLRQAQVRYVSFLISNLLHRRSFDPLGACSSFSHSSSPFSSFEARVPWNFTSMSEIGQGCTMAIIRKGTIAVWASSISNAAPRVSKRSKLLHLLSV